MKAVKVVLMVPTKVEHKFTASICKNTKDSKEKGILRISLPFIGPEDSLPYSQEPATSSYLEQMNLFHILKSHLCMIHFNIILISMSKLPK
jgi:hypothetical protein